MKKNNLNARSKIPEPSPDLEVLQPQDVFSAFDEVEKRGLRPAVTMLDPWYNRGVGGIVDNYDEFIEQLLIRACRISAHVYLWGFPEIIGPYVRVVPQSHRMNAWLTWYYKNNPSVIRGWRSGQMACFHLSAADAPMYPQHFLNSAQKELLRNKKLRYMPAPSTVIESPLIIGFVGKKEQTGHPAQKPLAVYDRLIRMTTVEGDLIFDPMCGSGTLGVIAKIRNRRAILNDMNPEYVAIVRARLEQDVTDLDKKLDLDGNNRESNPPIVRLL
jgi:site-specific DNA-methyltransferase (adenine-specific)